MIGQLYGIERAASDKPLDAPARERLRQAQARPILEKLHAYLNEQQATALPKSPLGAANCGRTRPHKLPPDTGATPPHEGR
jgi:hypothetical protein